MEHKTVSLADQIFSELENNILTGVYAIGEVFTEMCLSQTLGVSRTPVREAIRRLEQEHLVEVTTKGIVVLGITPRDVSDMYEIRMRTEGLASRWAAAVLSEEGKKELVKIVELQEFYTEKKDVENIKNMDSKFHEMVYKNCGSVVLSDILHRLHKKMTKYRRASVSDSERAFQSAGEHREILEAILKGDGNLAEKLTLAHIENARKSIENKINERERD